MLVVGLFAAAQFAYVAGSSFVLQQQYRLTEQEFGLVFAASVAGLIGAIQFNVVLLRRYTSLQILRAALIAGTAAGAVLLFFALTGLGGLTTLLASLILVLAAIGLAFPNAPALAMTRHGEAAGTAAALLGAVQFGGGALGAPLVGVLGGGSVALALAAIQIARGVGARPVALTRTSAKRRQLLDIGAEAVVATTEQDVVAAVNELTGGQGARVIFDPVGGPALARLFSAAAPGGTVIVYGALSTGATTVSALDLIGKSLTIRGYKLFDLTTDPERRSVAVDWILGGVARKVLRPVIDSTFSLAEIVEAHRRLESGSQVGKIVVTVPRR